MNKLQARNLRQLILVSRRLASDLARLSERVEERLGERKELGKRDDAFFYEKAFVRALFTLGEAAASVMRAGILQANRHRVLALPPRDLAKLLEQRFDPGRGVVLASRARIGFLSRLKYALRYYPRVFGSTYSSNMSGRDWEALLKLLRVRNRLTHPAGLANLLPNRHYKLMGNAADWLLGEIQAIVATCGGSEPVWPSVPVFFADARIQDQLGLAIDTEAIFDDEFQQKVASNELAAMRYMRQVVALLHEEAVGAMDAFSGFLAEGATNRQSTALGGRLFITSLVSVAEGTTGYVRTYLMSAKSKVTEKHLESLGMATGVAEKLAGTVELFSKVVGSRAAIDQGSEAWRSFRGSL
jgi:hypothetical protein